MSNRMALACLGLFTATALGGGCGGQGEEETKRMACTQMRDHVIDVRLNDFSTVTDEHGQPINLEGHRTALTNALGDAFIDECINKMTITQLECARAATSVSSVTDCSNH